jgi:FkbH-like protein
MSTIASVKSASREAFDAAVQAGDVAKAMRHARTLLRDDPSMRQFAHVRRAASSLRGDGKLKPYKVALASSFSIEFVHDPLAAHAFTEGFDLSIYQAGFDQYRQELLNPGGGLYRFAPDLVILAIEGKRLAPSLYDTYLDDAIESGDQVVAEAEAELRGLIAAFRQNTTAALLIHSLAPPIWRDLGVLDGHIGTGQCALVHRINEKLYALAREFPAVYVIDYVGLVARAGSERWYDLRLAHFAQAPIAQPILGVLAREYLKFLRALVGRSRKCLVLDLDNTLWGGVVGEDGVDGIAIGANYPGSAFLDFQREILKLRKRGVILAVASKNNPGDVDEVFEKRAEMLLKKEDFSDLRISWDPKEMALPLIATKLNIGLDHVVFADDNPVECERIAEALPSVTVVALPKQPERYIEALLEDGLFDTLSMTAEDLRRGDLYKQMQEAEALRAASGSLEEFYRKLGTEVEIDPVGKASLARAAQMTQKTNQFNTTTMRFSEADIEKRLTAPDWICATVRVKDRFGDSGLTGLFMAHVEDDRLEVETFLLSCRVIGRGVETSMLRSLGRAAKERSLKAVTGKIIPTKKNLPVRGLYADHGFTLVAKTGPEESEEWRREDAHAIVVPDWTAVRDAT